MTVLFILLAVFVACTGYAAGRVHQWYRTGVDRDDAYRDGYDTATRSVFSLAARVIGPRRGEKAAIRASASVRTIPGSSADVVAASVDPFDGAGFPVPEPVSPSAFSNGSRRASSGASVEAGSSKAGSSKAGSSKAGSSKAGSSEAGSSKAGSSKAGSSEAGSSGDLEETGRHNVPEELVRAATYRLPPDRVARAKVPKVAGQLDDDDTTRLPEGAAPVSVPKPRSS
jgi:hypothetical protein